jgi:hypothetical protein
MVGVSCSESHRIGGEFEIEAVKLDGVEQVAHDRTKGLVEVPGARVTLQPFWQGGTYISVRFSIRGEARVMLEEYRIEAYYLDYLTPTATPEYFARESAQSGTTPLRLPLKVVSGTQVNMYAPALDYANGRHIFHVAIDVEGRKHVIEVFGKRML